MSLTQLGNEKSGTSADEVLSPQNEYPALVFSDLLVTSSDLRTPAP